MTYNKFFTTIDVVYIALSFRSIRAFTSRAAAADRLRDRRPNVFI